MKKIMPTNTHKKNKKGKTANKSKTSFHSFN